MDELDPDVLAVFPFGVGTELSVLKDHRIGIPRPLILRVSCMPQRGLIEARVPYLHSFVTSQFRSRIVGWIVALKLPLASDAGAVARLFHPVPERLCFGIQTSEVQPVSIVIEPRHQLNASVRAQRLRIRMGKPLPFRRHLIQPRSSITGSAVTVQPFNSDVIRHDDNHIRASALLGRKHFFINHQQSDHRQHRNGHPFE